MFSAHGTIERANIIRNKATKLPKGYGFIVYSNETDAQTAIQEKNGFLWLGKTIKVSLAIRQSNLKENRKLYITNLPKEFTETQLQSIFEQ